METAPFLRLPAEIRDQIYGYLLSTKYNKHYPREIDLEWECDPSNSFDYIPTTHQKPRPTHVYRLEVGILGANRQINREASNILYDQNMFVKLTTDLTNWQINFAWFGVPIVAQGDRASRFVCSVMHIKLEPEHVVRRQREPSQQFIFAGADLPAFCTALLLGGKSPKLIFEKSLLVNLDCNTVAGKVSNRASYTTLQLENLLKPLHTLHSFRSAYITGPLDAQYTTDLCLSICKRAPSCQESIFEVQEKVQKGDEALNDGDGPGHYRQAINIYSAAMIHLKDRCSRTYWTVERPIGPVALAAADKLHKAYTTLLLKLRINLATAHF